MHEQFPEIKIKKIPENFEPLSQEEIEMLDEEDKAEYYSNLEIWNERRIKELMDKAAEALENEASEKQKEAYEQSMEELYKKDSNEPYWQR